MQASFDRDQPCGNTRFAAWGFGFACILLSSCAHKQPNADTASVNAHIGRSGAAISQASQSTETIRQSVSGASSDVRGANTLAARTDAKATVVLEYLRSHRRQ